MDATTWRFGRHAEAHRWCATRTVARLLTSGEGPGTIGAYLETAKGVMAMPDKGPGSTGGAKKPKGGKAKVGKK